MTEPRRIKVEGDYFHGHIPPGAIYVGRGAPGLPHSCYANPYPVKQYGLEGSIKRYRRYLAARTDLADQARTELAGRDLACWCPLDRPCHADVLLEIANKDGRSADG